MVPGSRLLLIAALAALTGCKAELLGVELPRGGRDAISQEDLQRDTWSLSQIPDRPTNPDAVAQTLSMRFQQMHTRPGYSRSYVDAAGAARIICAEKDGRGEERVLLLATDDGTVSGGAVPSAALVSVLKGFDTPQAPPRSVVVCVLVGEGAEARFLKQPPLPLDGADIHLIGPLGEGAPRTEAAALGPHAAQRHALGQPPTPDTMESRDYRAVREAVVALFDRVAAEPE